MGEVMDDYINSNACYQSSMSVETSVLLAAPR
jgi:hypothetical protein